MVGRRKKGQQKVQEWEFDNPVQGDSLEVASDAKDDQSDSDDPQSPPASPSAEKFDVQLDQDQHERQFKRGTLYHTIFMAVMIPLIPGYGLFALLMGWHQVAISAESWPIIRAPGKPSAAHRMCSCA